MKPLFAFAVCASASLWAQSSGVLRVDHYVTVKSAVPSIAGQTTSIYVREVVRPDALRGNPAPDKVALFIHGAGTPAEVAFDVPHSDFSWMAYLAQAGYDVFSMDMTGYGRSTRPNAISIKEMRSKFINFPSLFSLSGTVYRLPHPHPSPEGRRAFNPSPAGRAG